MGDDGLWQDDAAVVPPHGDVQRHGPLEDAELPHLCGTEVRDHGTCCSQPSLVKPLRRAEQASANSDDLTLSQGALDRLLTHLPTQIRPACAAAERRHGLDDGHAEA